MERHTRETTIDVRVGLDVQGPIQVASGIGFFDHMLEQLAHHGGFALQLQCQGDLSIDEHHTVEDCALALGKRSVAPWAANSASRATASYRPWMRRWCRSPSIFATAPGAL